MSKWGSCDFKQLTKLSDNIKTLNDGINDTIRM
ncbi:hypothetical protein CLPUN_03260 [Clostridium puniceum]|uniref:Uncharacterized protein n=1 Tax=Clostridium puniceum TaxID=29367 RepID=A0A1S8TY36_9CLOT|nr:hypothetical protein CLPUN_03260 [Clostridium puniceum]